jgi:hypothetical protein
VTGSQPPRRSGPDPKTSHPLRRLGQLGLMVLLIGAGTGSTTLAGQPTPGGLPHATLPSPVKPAAVFGSDDRIALPRGHAKLKDSIGTLFSSQARTLCTAFCVADAIVATAGHCLFRTAGDPLPTLEDFAFSIGGPKQPQVRIAGHQTRSSLQNIASGGVSLSLNPPIEATRDWALVRLSSPICRGRQLPLEPMVESDLVTAAAENRLSLAGFHRDFADWRMALSRDCSIRPTAHGSDGHPYRRDFVDPDRLILHTCDTGGASSGAPLLLDTLAGPVVVGINVGTYVQSRVMLKNGEVIHRFKASEIANTGVGIAAVAEALQHFRDSTVLGSGESIRTLQRHLKAMSLYAGPLDGVHGPKLRFAIEAHQRASRAIVLGLPTPELLMQLSVSGADKRGWEHAPGASLAGNARSDPTTTRR